MTAGSDDPFDDPFEDALGDRSEDPIERWIELAEQAMDEEDFAAAEAWCDRVLAHRPDSPAGWLLRGDLRAGQGDRAAASEAYRRAALAAPELGQGWSALALCQFEQLQLAEAQATCLRALRADPACAEAWWVRSLLREWQGDEEGARRAAAHAHWLEPADHPEPLHLSDEEVDALVTEALAELPAPVRDALAELPIVVEAMPDASTCRSYDPPASPLDLLGCFHGPSLRDRSALDPWSQVPGQIALYKGNLARLAGDREELIDQLRITLLHEVGHFLGLDEQDLEDRGLD